MMTHDETDPDRPADAAGIARIYLRPSGAQQHGHTGWSFSLPGGGHLVGGVEMPNKSFCLWHEPRGMGFWAMKVEDPVATMSAPPHFQEWHTRYDLYKTIDVPNPDVRAALRAVRQVSRSAWRLVGKNCLNDAYDILRAYGATNLPALSHIWGPIRFFNDVAARAEVVMTPIGPVDATLYDGDGYSGKRFAILAPGHHADLAACGWDGRARSVIVRSGRLTLYTDADCQGEELVVSAGTAANLSTLRDGYVVRSYQAAPDRQTPHAKPHEMKIIVPDESGPESGSSPNMPQSLRGHTQIPVVDALVPRAGGAVMVSHGRI